MKGLWFNTKSHLSTIEGNQKLADCIHDICLLLSEDCRDNWLAWEILDCRINHLTGYWMKATNQPKVIEKLIELKNEIEKALIQAKKDGIKQGQNLLLQLNRGEITLNDLQ